MDLDLAARSRSIDPGVLGIRLRNARVAAGLTQAEAAGGEVTSAYISRIEAGARRPEAHLLERLAQRLKTSLETLLAEESIDRRAEVELELGLIELSLAGGEQADILERLDALDAKIPGGTLEDLHLRARQLRALAYEAAGGVQEAITILEEICQQPRANGDWLRALIALTRNYRESGEFDRAIVMGERAQAVIADLGLEGLTEAIQLTVSLAAVHMAKGDNDFALRECRRALAAADRVGSHLGKASAYWNSSLVLNRQGATAEALELARKALVLFEISDDVRNVGRLRTQVAHLQLRQDPPDAEGARQTLVVAQYELDRSSASAQDKADRHLALARAQLLLGNLEESNRELDVCEDLIGGESPVLAAEASVVRGQAAHRQGDAAAALGYYQVAVRALTGVGADRDAAQLWFELGTLLDEAGDPAGARDAYRSAAASSGLGISARAAALR